MKVLKKKRIAAMFLLAVLLCLLLPTQAAALNVKPVIVHAPQNYRWQVGSVATYYCECEGDPNGEYYQYEWFVRVDGKEYHLNYEEPGSAFWTAYAPGINSGLYYGAAQFDNVRAGLDGAEIWCVVYSPTEETESPHAMIMIDSGEIFPPPEITAPVKVSCAQNEALTLTVDASGRSGNVSEFKDGLTYYWYQTSTGNLIHAQLMFDSKGDPISGKSLKVDTSKAGTFYYLCAVWDGEDTPYANLSYSNVITVEISKAEPPATEPPATKPPATEPPAATVPLPVITKQPEGGVFASGDFCKLEIRATAPEGAWLRYQCYSTDDPASDTLTELPGATSELCFPAEQTGTVYYLCRVWAETDEAVSENVFSDPAAVTFLAPETQEQTEPPVPAASTAPTPSVPPGTEPATGQRGGSLLLVLAIVFIVLAVLAGAGVAVVLILLLRKKK